MPGAQTRRKRRVSGRNLTINASRLAPLPTFKTFLGCDGRLQRVPAKYPVDFATKVFEEAGYDSGAFGRAKRVQLYTVDLIYFYLIQIKPLASRKMK